METINEKCCDAVTNEICCDKPAPLNVNVYYGRGSCCSVGSSGNGSIDDGGSGTNNHDKLENKNLGVQHDASAIGFADGETFQEKYDKGELTGPKGEPGDGIDSIISGQVIGVGGVMSIPASSGTATVEGKLIPMYGNIDEINSEGKWVCPKDGIYSLTGHLGLGMDATSSRFTAYWHKTTGGVVTTIAIDVTTGPSTGASTGTSAKSLTGEAMVWDKEKPPNKGGSF